MTKFINKLIKGENYNPVHKIPAKPNIGILLMSVIMSFVNTSFGATPGVVVLWGKEFIRISSRKRATAQ